MVRTYKGSGATIPVFSISTNPSGRETLRHANYFRNICEKFERIFYQKDFVIVCSVDGLGLELRVMNVKKGSGKTFDPRDQSSSLLNQDKGVRLRFDSPIVRDVVLIDFSENVRQFEKKFDRLEPSNSHTSRAYSGGGCLPVCSGRRRFDDQPERAP